MHIIPAIIMFFVGAFILLAATLGMLPLILPNENKFYFLGNFIFHGAIYLLGAGLVVASSIFFVIRLVSKVTGRD